MKCVDGGVPLTRKLLYNLFLVHLLIALSVNVRVSANEDGLFHRQVTDLDPIIMMIGQ